MKVNVMDRRDRRATGAVILGLAAGLILGIAGVARAEGGTVAMVRAERAEIVRGRVLGGLDGASLDLARLRGEVVVINFWASWCRPCRRELPELDALHTELARQGGRVLAVSIDEDPRNARRFVRENRLRLPVFHDGPAGLANALALDHIPYTLILDRDGEIAYATPGASPREWTELAAVARRLAAQDGKRSAWIPGEGR